METSEQYAQIVHVALVFSLFTLSKSMLSWFLVWNKPNHSYKDKWVELELPTNPTQIQISKNQK